MASLFFFFFFNDTATTEIYTLSLHDALPIWQPSRPEHRKPETARSVRETALSRTRSSFSQRAGAKHPRATRGARGDRKSTRLNSSHLVISYAVFCLKKKTRRH